MRLISLSVQNFGSYKDCTFDFEQLGLSLVYGSTGSGKSTICDMACWVLFGITAKDGAVDEVRSWQTPDTPTKGILYLDINDTKLTVTRVRGKANQNELYWTEEGGEERRGKDNIETQRFLNDRLGFDATLYTVAAYFHEFSPTAHFFNSNAKVRRSILERVANLELAARIAAGASNHRKLSKESLQEAKQLYAGYEASRFACDRGLSAGRTSLFEWSSTQHSNIRSLKAKAKDFDKAKEEHLKALSKKSQDWQETRIKDTDELIAKLENVKVGIEQGKHFEAAINDAKKQIKALEPLKLQRLDIFSQVCELKAKIEAVDFDIAQRNKMGDVCPTCMGPTNNPNRIDYLYNLTKTAVDMKEKLGSLTLKLKTVDTQVKAEKPLLEQLAALKENVDHIKSLKERFEEGKIQLGKLQTLVNPYIEQIIDIDAAVNTYEELAAQEEKKENPFQAQVDSLNKEYQDIDIKYNDSKERVTYLEHKIVGLTRIYDLSFEFRGVLLNSAVREIEAETNRYLETYFDAEIRVTFSAEDADNLEVSIQKSGYECSYKQLSKGQRGLLKLSFAAAVMKAASNKSGVHFENLFFDEALDGLDNALKVKAFSLFEELEGDHESILLVEHAPEFQNMFTKKFHVTLDSDVSQVVLDG